MPPALGEYRVPAERETAASCLPLDLFAELLVPPVFLGTAFLPAVVTPFFFAGATAFFVAFFAFTVAFFTAAAPAPFRAVTFGALPVRSLLLAAAFFAADLPAVLLFPEATACFPPLRACEGVLAAFRWLLLVALPLVATLVAFFLAMMENIRYCNRVAAKGREIWFDRKCFEDGPDHVGGKHFPIFAAP